VSERLTPEQQLGVLYKQVNTLNDDLPGDVLKKLKLYAEILTWTGKLHSESLKAWKLAESKRKETVATVYSLDPNGTSKEREMKAEMAASEFRREEAVAEANCMRWKNAYTSTTEYINILKIQLKDMKDLNQGGV
jgi:hypothetical protein